jgi:hypothetical protein
MSKASRLTEAGAEIFLKEHRELYDGEPCEYGHFGDSTYEGGPCLDEVLHLFPDLETQ